MKEYTDHIEQCLKDYPNDKMSFKFKKQILNEMENRSKEIRARGLADENVLHDLVIDENQNIPERYKKYVNDVNFKNRVKRLPAISAIYVLALTVAFLFVGFVFHKWHPGWLIMEAGISALLIGLMMFFVPRLKNTKLHFLARLFTMGSVMIGAQAIFLVVRMLTHNHSSFLIVVAAPAIMLLSDLILATVAKRRMLILNYLLYVPAIMSIVYALLGITHLIPWNPGWLLMIAAVAIDIGILVGVIAYNKKYTYKPEVENA